jgi:hypothetical protein
MKEELLPQVDEQSGKVPPHAMSIWIEGGVIHLGFTNPKGYTHVSELQPERLGITKTPTGSPISSQTGWHVLLETLRHRERLGRAPRMDEHGPNVTRHQLELAVKNFGGTVKVVGRKRDAVGELKLEDLDL